MHKDFVIYIDFDRTLYDSGRFSDDLWALIGRQAGIDPSQVAESVAKFETHETLGGYDYEAHIRAFGLDPAQMWAKLAQLLDAYDYLYDDSARFVQSLLGSGYRPRILSFGNYKFQAAKIAPTLDVLAGTTGHELGYDIVMRRKREHLIEYHPGEHGVLIDDKPGQELPEGFTEITLDRPRGLAEVVREGPAYVASDLAQVRALIEDLRAPAAF